MIEKLEQWIDQTLQDYSNEKKSCECFLTDFKGFYPAEFLSTSSFVVLDQIPKPDFPELRQAGFGDFIDMEAVGITYKNTYFVKKGDEKRLDLHFHELVHVLQWQFLGVQGFMSRYMDEITQYGYDKAPLEIMAYYLDGHFSSKGHIFSIPDYVKNNL